MRCHESLPILVGLGSVAGQSDHAFRSRIRIRQILLFAIRVARGVGICMHEISRLYMHVRAYVVTFGEPERFLAHGNAPVRFFAPFPLVAVGKSEKRDPSFFTRDTRHIAHSPISARCIYLSCDAPSAVPGFSNESHLTVPSNVQDLPKSDVAFFRYH